MIYITLTDFYNNFYINQSIFRLYKEHPDMFKEPTAIVGSSGSFPFNYWNGGYNSNEGKFLLKVEYEDLERNTYMPIRLDYSNIFLTEDDFQNSYNNTILKIFNTGSHYVEVSNLALLEYIKNVYPLMKSVFSSKADIFYTLTPDIVNKAIQEGGMDIVSLPTKYIENNEFLNGLQYKNQIEIPVNTVCGVCDNLQQENCIKTEHFSQYNFSGNSVFNSCTKCLNGNKCLINFDFEKLKELTKKGFNKFLVNSFPKTKDPNGLLFVEFFVDYFIKDEYKFMAQSFILQGKENHI